MSRLRPLLAAGLLLAVAPVPAPARADTAPLYFPRGDVTVTYSVTGVGRGGDEAVTAQAQIAANGTRARIEAQGLPGFLVVDRGANRVIVVMQAQHMFMEMPGGNGQVNRYMPGPDTHFTRGGSETIAGLSCTDWQVSDPHGTGTACLTADGIILRGEAPGRNGPVRIVATAVDRAALPAGLFAPPAGFQKLDIPQGVGAPGGVPGAPRR